jgi:hypothetical protein
MVSFWNFPCATLSLRSVGFRSSDPAEGVNRWLYPPMTSSSNRSCGILRSIPKALRIDGSEAASATLEISDSDKQILPPSRTQPVYKNRAGWAHDRLKRARLSSSPRRGYWKLTNEGINYASLHPVPLTEDQVKALAVADPAVRLRPLTTMQTIRLVPYSITILKIRCLLQTIVSKAPLLS